MTNSLPTASGQTLLKDLKNGLYQIHSEYNGAFEGTISAIFKRIKKWGINENDFIYATRLLKETGDIYADFGIFGRFLYTYDTDFEI